MGTSITVRDIDPRYKSWLRREARQVGVSMEELVRRLIHEKCAKTERHGHMGDGGFDQPCRELVLPELSVEAEDELVEVLLEPRSGDAVEEHQENLESLTHVAFVEALMVADYAIDPDPGQDALERFALQNASFQVWPYWREYLANQCRRTNLPPVMLTMRQFARPTDNPPDRSS